MARLSPEEFEKRSLENHKLHYDLFKHLTTLATGSVVLVAMMLDKAFPNAAHRWLVTIAVGCFMASVVCSVFMMFANVVTIRATGDEDQQPGCWFVTTIALLGSPILFTIGLMFLVAFVVSNT